MAVGVPIRSREAADLEGRWPPAWLWGGLFDGSRRVRMSVTQLTGDGITVVVPAERVDSHGAERLGNALQLAISAKVRRLVVDMSGVTYIGSKGLQALISALAECRHRGGDLKLAGATPNVMHVLDLIQFDRVFSMCACVESAIKEFRVRQHQNES
jgi:anti-sigma B factor antagonist